MTTDLNKAGVKDDGGKLMYDLIPTSAIRGLAEVLTMGAKKYTPNGWRTVPNATERYYAALYRHLLAWRDGEKIDPESGLSHLKHVMINVAFLLELDGTIDTQASESDPLNCDNYSCLYKDLIDELKQNGGSITLCSSCDRHIKQCVCQCRGHN